MPLVLIKEAGKSRTSCFQAYFGWWDPPSNQTIFFVWQLNLWEPFFPRLSCNVNIHSNACFFQRILVGLVVFVLWKSLWAKPSAFTNLSFVSAYELLFYYSVILLQALVTKTHSRSGMFEMEHWQDRFNITSTYLVPFTSDSSTTRIRALAPLIEFLI